MTADAVERAAQGVVSAMSAQGFVMPLPAARVVARAALTATRAGDATAETVVAEVERRLREDGYGDSDRVRTALLHIDAYRAGRARAGEVVDREALIERVYWEVTDDEVSREVIGKVLDALAARGAAAPTVTAEQVTEAAGLLWEHQTGWRRDQAPASAMDDRRRQVRRVLGVVGIEELP